MSVRVQNVRFSYDAETPVLQGVSFDCPSGEILSLLGANGAGKTTLFEIVAGLKRPSVGTVQVCGIDVVASSQQAKQKLAYIPERPVLYPELSALENLNLFGQLWGVNHDSIQERAESLLREVDLWSVRHQWVEAYSTGMKKKLSLCTALIHDPAVLLIDEPFSGLDIEAGWWARGILRSFARDGGCVVFTSHTPELVSAFAERIIILLDGRIVYDERQHTAEEEGGIEQVYTRLHAEGDSDPADPSNSETTVRT